MDFFNISKLSRPAVAEYRPAMLVKSSLEEAFSRVCPENSLERKILEDVEWREGASLGKPRPGHPEGEIIYHILEVLANVDQWCATHQTSPEDRSKMRAISMIHDTFKHKVDRNIPEEGENHHASIARRFGETIGITDSEMLAIIEHHDDAYLIWRAANQTQEWDEAKEKLLQLMDCLKNEGARIGLYEAFYWCDNRTGDKEPSPVIWFQNQISLGGQNSDTDLRGEISRSSSQRKFLRENRSATVAKVQYASPEEERRILGFHCYQRIEAINSIWELDEATKRGMIQSDITIYLTSKGTPVALELLRDYRESWGFRD